MARARLLKMHILAPQSRRDELMEWLYGLNAVHILDLASRLATDEETAELIRGFQPNLRGWHLELSRADFLIDFMERYGYVKKAKLGGLIPDRVHVSEEEWATLLEDVDLRGLYAECEALDVRFKQLVAEGTELERELQRLAPWSELDVDMEDLAGTAEEDRSVLGRKGCKVETHSRGELDIARAGAGRDQRRIRERERLPGL